MKQTTSALIPALRKRGLDDRLYARPAEIEARLSELAQLSRSELARVCSIRRPVDPEYVRDECLTHFVRESRSDNSDAHFDRLYKILIERVLRKLPRPDDNAGRTTSLKLAKIRDKVRDRFIARLCEDRTSYCDKLDFFEVHFDSALKRLRLTAQDEVWREENRTTMLAADEETGEPSPEIEKAAGSFNPFADEDSELEDYRSSLDAAIDELPREQIRIIEMLRHDVPIDSKDPYAVTIAKTLGKSEKTIRSWRNAAFKAIRAHRERG